MKTESENLQDVQNRVDKRGIAIQRVGISDVTFTNKARTA